jgi:hypothetical protein
MKKQVVSQFIKVVSLAIFLALFIGCSGCSDDKNPLSDDDNPMGGTDNYPTTQFTVIGDVPYNDGERAGLIDLIDAHNARATSDFVVHVGDIKPGSEPCNQPVYEDVSGILKRFEIPTFIVLGDNEYNDCDTPSEALDLWNAYFLHFNKNWEFPVEIEYQEERPENFAWVRNGVLFLGLNLVGSSVHDQAEWNDRLADDAEWVEKQLNVQDDKVAATVLFWHANVTEVGPEKFESFTNRFKSAAGAFGKPVLYMQGDGHFWFKNRPWPEQNILRVQVEAGVHAVQVTVDPDLEEPFSFDREFLD